MRQLRNESDTMGTVRGRSAGRLVALLLASLGLALSGVALVGLMSDPPRTAPTRAAQITSPDSVPTEANSAQAVLSPRLQDLLRGTSEEQSLPVLVFPLPPAHQGPATHSMHLSPVERSARVQQEAQQFDTLAEPLYRAITDLSAPGSAGAMKLWLLGAISAELRPSAIRTLRSRRDVMLIRPDARIPLMPLGASESEAASRSSDSALAPMKLDQTQSLQWGVREVQADQVHVLLGLDGQDITVAIIDTGIEYNHPDLMRRYRGFSEGRPPQNKNNWFCVERVDPLCSIGRLYPVDGVGHGTHVAGIVLGEDGTGVAPGARWIAARACGGEGCPVSWITAALQWIAEMGEEAPQVINLSLGTTDRVEAAQMKPMIDRIVEEFGILVVASIGNRRNAISMPGALESVIGVGATTPQGEVWDSSARGYTDRGLAKPDLVAPGAGVTSTLPGGGMGRRSGTSMASPHVAGIAALMLQARPDLAPAAVKRVLMDEARSLQPGHQASTIEDGAGMADAYGAVMAITEAGQFRGRITRVGDRQPITWAKVHIALPNGDRLSTLKVAPEDGRFAIDLAPGSYLVIAEAFGYQEESRRLTIEDDRETRFDPILELYQPKGVFSGEVHDAENQAPLSASLRLSGVPFPIESDETFGFSQQLPERSYNLRVERFGYRVIEDSVKVTSARPVTRSYALQQAPRILLVDGDAWAFDGAIEFFRDSLDRLGLLYHEHAVTHVNAGPGNPGGAPSLDKLRNYDIVIWASAISSPNAVMGAYALNGYLELGGRLILSGQSALCNDAGRAVRGQPCQANSPPHPYVEDKLYLEVISDVVPLEMQIRGADDGPFAGMSFELNGADSMNNQSMPVGLVVRDSNHGRVLANYASGQGAGLLVQTCLDHRAIALGFGFEGVNGAVVRDELMQRSIDALMADDPAAGLNLKVEDDHLVQDAGDEADYNVELINTGAQVGNFKVEVVEGKWEHSLWNLDFTSPLPESIELPSCQTLNLGVRVEVPADMARGVRNELTLRVFDETAGTEQFIQLSTSAPAPVLVVDGDYSKHSEARYLEGLEAAGIAYDHWDLGLFSSQAIRPHTDTLLSYPMVIWFTGYNVLQPERNFGIEAQTAAAGYLDAGGRLLLASEDFLWHWGATPFADSRRFHRDYFGIDTFMDNGGFAHEGDLKGAKDSIYEGLEGCEMVFRQEGLDYSDRVDVQNNPLARTALLSRSGVPIASQYERPRGLRSIFLGFDAGDLGSACATEIMARSVDWFSPVEPSRLTRVQDDGLLDKRRTYRSGDQMRLRLRLNRLDKGDAPLRVQWALPSGASADLSSLPAGWQAISSTLHWEGELRADETKDIEIEIVLDEDLGNDHQMQSTALLYSDGITVTRQSEWHVNAADISRSTKSVPDAGRVLAYGERGKLLDQCL